MRRMWAAGAAVAMCLALGGLPVTAEESLGASSETPLPLVASGTSGPCTTIDPWRETAYDDDGRQTYRNGSGNQTVRPSNGGMSKSEYRTLGWRPSCDCGAADSVAGVVLDPFAGSGTTAEVALTHGRSAVLVELNPEYLPLQHARIEAARKTQPALMEVI